MAQVVIKPQQKKGKGGSGSGGKKIKTRGEDGKRFNATIVVATTSCEIARSGRKSKRNSVPPREKISAAPFAHTDGTPGWNPWAIREQRGRR